MTFFLYFDYLIYDHYEHYVVFLKIFIKQLFDILKNV